MAGFKHILVATDFEQPSLRAVDTAVDLALEFGSELTLVHAWEIPPYAYTYGMAGYGAFDLASPLQSAATGQLDTLLMRVRERLPRAKSLVLNGPPASEIIAAASTLGADLIVVGTHGRKGLAHVLLGSVAERIVRLSPVPVLVAREPREQQSGPQQA